MAPIKQKILRRLSVIVVCLTLFLIFAGGMVTSTGSGLAVPTWPLTYGMFFPPMVGGVMYEYSHRIVAGIDGLLILTLVIMILIYEKARWVKVAALVTFGLVVIQSMLGALTAWLLLPVWLSFSHGVVSQTVFLSTVILAYSQSGARVNMEAGEMAGNAYGTLFRRFMVFIALVYAQLIIGSIMRHTGSGLAIPDFPTMAGSWFPNFNRATLDWINSWRINHLMKTVTMGQIWINFSHRLTALIVFLAAIDINFFVWKRSAGMPQWLKRALILLDALLISQVTLGAFVIWTRGQPVLTTFHVMTGAGVLGLSALLFLRLAPASWHRSKVLPAER